MKTKLHQLDKFTILSLLDDQENMAHKSMGISQIIHSYYNNNGYVESDDHSSVESYEIKDNQHLYDLLSFMCYDFIDFILEKFDAAGDYGSVSKEVEEYIANAIK